MREWFHDPANEKKTPEDAETYRKQIEAPAIYDIARKSLIPKNQ